MFHRRAALGLKTERQTRVQCSSSLHREDKANRAAAHFGIIKEINRTFQNLDKISRSLVQCDKIAGLSFGLSVCRSVRAFWSEQEISVR